MTPRERGPLLLLYERFHVLLLVTGAAVAAAFLVSRALTPMYRGQVRCFLPTVQDVLLLTSEEPNIPKGPKLPVSSTETQDSIVGVARSAQLRVAVANRIPERNIEHLEKQVDIEIDKFNSLVITAWDPDPRLAAETARIYLEEFQRWLHEANQRSVARTMEILQGAIRETQARLDQAQRELVDFLQARGAADYSTELDALAARIASLRGAIADLDVQIGTLDDLVAATQRQLAEREKVLVDREFVLSGQAETRNQRIEELRGEIGARETALASLRVRYQEAHPDVQRELAALEELRGELAAEEAVPFVPGSRNYTLDTIRARFEQQLHEYEIQREGLRAEREERQSQLDRALADWRTMPEFKSMLDTLTQRAGLLRQTLSNEMARLEEFKLYQAGRPEYLIVTEGAVEPTEPHYPNVPLNMAVAGLLGLATSVVLVVILDRIRTYREQAAW